MLIRGRCHKELSPLRASIGFGHAVSKIPHGIAELAMLSLIRIPREKPPLHAHKGACHKELSPLRASTMGGQLLMTLEFYI
ncbi:hypothetical protein GCWU000341_01326 [Oribacterium sp. oral taxon 078 str. F0262]|nr:hypothetical protein GCWU000341_01326 [Oribacterium sp. oral taxon 078 str. F0262]